MVTWARNGNLGKDWQSLVDDWCELEASMGYGTVSKASYFVYKPRDSRETTVLTLSCF